MALNNAFSSTYTATAAGAVGGYYSRPLVARSASLAHFPRQVTLVGDLFDQHVLIQPITVNLEQSDGKIIASDDVFYMYGEGNTRQEALFDYLSSLSEYYELLESYDDAPSVELLSYLQTYLRPRNT